jgi:arylsulfatase/arylsulfatase A
MTRLTLFITLLSFPLLLTAADKPPVVSQPVLSFVDGSNPNILLMMTDDQGYGDMSGHGNPVLKTPHLDRLAEESTEFTQFAVCPNCSPTRASLMTGRYNYRTGVTEVVRGNFMMFNDETTIAEILRDAGYRTGIFGKWHLGDNYPMRPTDQGFEEALVHKAGGIGQGAGPAGNKYFDPILEHNDEPKTYKGYCDDIFTDAAMEFIEKKSDKPFFTYLATNLPHFPLVVSDELADPYRKLGEHEHNALTFGMVASIDNNVGRILAKLKELNLEESTIVIFMSDNGPRTRRSKNDMYPDRYVANLRGTKTSIYDNGIRVPFFIRWPGHFPAGKKTDTIAAHIDVLPTLLEAAGVSKPQAVHMDGVSLLPLINGQPTNWPDRTLYFHYNAGPIPFQYVHFAARGQRYKLISPHDDPHNYNQPPDAREKKRLLDSLELYDIQKDPSEINNLARQHPEIVEHMLAEYETWFEDVTRDRDYFIPERTQIGTPHQKKVILSQFDWRGSVENGGLGHWYLKSNDTAKYRITLHYDKTPKNGMAHLRYKGKQFEKTINRGSTKIVFSSVELPAAKGRFEAFLKFNRLASPVRFVDIELID